MAGAGGAAGGRPLVSATCASSASRGPSSATSSAPAGGPNGRTPSSRRRPAPCRATSCLCVAVAHAGPQVAARWPDGRWSAWAAGVGARRGDGVRRARPVLRPRGGCPIRPDRRSVDALRHPADDPPVPSRARRAPLRRRTSRAIRTALGAVAACVQQRLTTAERLLAVGAVLRPLRRAAGHSRPPRRPRPAGRSPGGGRRRAAVSALGAGATTPPAAPAGPSRAAGAYTDCRVGPSRRPGARPRDRRCASTSTSLYVRRGRQATPGPDDRRRASSSGARRTRSGTSPGLVGDLVALGVPRPPDVGC